MTIGGKTAKELAQVKRNESLEHHFQAAAMLPELLRKSVIATVENVVGKPAAQEIHKRYAWADFPDGQRRNVLMTVIRWSGEKVTTDTAYSLEAMEVKEDAATAYRRLRTRTAAANAPEGNVGTLDQFLKGIKPEHRTLQGGLEGSTFALAPLGPGVRPVTAAPTVVEIKTDPFDGFKSDTKKGWLAKWKEWEAANKGEWRQTIDLPEGPVMIGGKTAGELGQVKRQESQRHHYEAATMMPELLKNSVIAAVENAAGKPTAQEIHKRYAWARFSDGETRNVLMTVIRWNGAEVNIDTAYSLEAMEV